MKEEFAGSTNWTCVRCDAELSPAIIKLSYINSEFEAELMSCPSCHKVFIGEPLAMGKMLEVERSLEDK